MSDKYAALKQAAQEEIMCRESGDTSDAWQDEASPEAILELLVERDADKARIIELSQKCENDPRIHEVIDLKERIAEHEARTLTVKLPPEVQGSNIPFAADGANAMRKEVVKALIEACAAAGISLKIEGE